MNQLNINTVLFDLGGVLLELSGMPTLIEWTKNKYSSEEIWEKWLSSSAVRAYESGRSSLEEFSKALIEEFDLPVDIVSLRKEFNIWLKGLYPGTIELLEEVRASHRIACFSNTNDLHWDKIKNDFGIYELFHKCFVSHETGFLKPDDKAFQYVIKELGSPPETLLFLDDNKINVDSAIANGMQAFCVSGVKEARGILVSIGLL